MEKVSWNTLKIDTVCSSKTLVRIHQYTRCHIQEDRHLYRMCLKFKGDNNGRVVDE